MESPRRHLVTAAVVCLAATVLALEPPLPVSPGSADRIERTLSPCPTFSWAPSPGALSLRLAIYAVPAYESAPPVLVVDRHLPAAAASWTPALGECLAAGTYAWGVGALTAEGGPNWSQAAWFEVVAEGTALPGIPETPRERPREGAVTPGSGATTPDGGSGVRGRVEPRAPSPERLAYSYFAVGASGAVKAGAVDATSFTGDGSGLTNLNATQLLSGTVPSGRLSGTYGINISGTAANVTGLANGGVTFGSGGGLAQDAGSFYWDNTNKRLGIGTPSPQQRLHVENGNLRLPQTTNAPTGVVYLGPTSFLHAYEPSAGLSNTFLGYGAGNFTLGGSGADGTNNTGIGRTALASLTTGWNNVAVGTDALKATTSGSYNTAIGVGSSQFNTGGYSNTAVGALALQNNTTAGQNTAVGVNSLLTQSFSNSNTVWESANTAVGYQALFANQPTSTDNGVHNTAVGAFALHSNTQGGYNAATGHKSLWANQTGNENTANGDLALRDNTSGNNNTAVGAGSLMTNQTGHGNTAVGWMALGNVAVGQSGNVALGHQAGLNETGSNKLHIANSSATDLVWGDFSTSQVVVNAPPGAGFVGAGLWVNGRLGASVLPTAPGNPICDIGGGVLGTCSGPSDARLKTAVVPLAEELDILAALARLRGVAFNWDRSQGPMQHASERREIGMIAQEVEEVLPSLVTQGKDGYRSLDYAKLTAFLVEVAKAQQAEIAELRRMVEALAASR